MSSVRIKQTPLAAQGVVVVTSCDLRVHDLQPHRTYVLRTDGTVSESADFVTAAAALLRHDRVVHRIANEKQT